jgi:hypothetical protein
MSWQQVAALALLIGGAITAAALHNDVIAATFAGAAAGFAINRNGRANHDASAQRFIASSRPDDPLSR